MEPTPDEYEALAWRIELLVRIKRKVREVMEEGEFPISKDLELLRFMEILGAEAVARTIEDAYHEIITTLDHQMSQLPNSPDRQTLVEKLREFRRRKDEENEKDSTA